MQPGGTKYSLIPEEEEEEEEGAAAGPEGDKKISQAEESSKKRKKVRGGLWLEKEMGVGICSVVTTELLQHCGCE